MEFAEVRRNFVAWHDGTHARRAEVKLGIAVSSQHLGEVIFLSYSERRGLPRRVEISCIIDPRSSDITTRRQGVAISFLDDPQNGGGRSRCVVCFNDPGFILLHANCGIVTYPVPRFLLVVYGVPAIWIVHGLHPDEYYLNDSPFIIVLTVWRTVDRNNFAVVLPSDCGVHVGAKNVGWANKNSPEKDIVERLTFEVIVSPPKMFPPPGPGGFMPYTETKPRRKS